MRDNKLLLELYANPGFGPYLRMIASLRPIIPAWSKETEREDWIYQTGLQAGFDLVMSFFEGDLE